MQELISLSLSSTPKPSSWNENLSKDPYALYKFTSFDINTEESIRV